MNVLLDTCVLGEIQHPKGDPKVKSRVAKFSAEGIYLSVLAVGEIAKGIGLLEASKRKTELTEWLLRLEQDFAARILPIDAEVARQWGNLTAKAQLRGIIIPVSDGLMAATALRHGLCVVTRNTRHFAASGAQIFDPWEEN